MKKEYIEAQVVFLTRRIHPQDLGEETSKLENTLRQALEDVEQEMLKRVVGEIVEMIEKKAWIILSGVLMNGYIQGQEGRKIDNSVKDEAMKKLIKLINTKK